MATATGKTVFMGILIAWQTRNKSRQPAGRRFTDAFLIVIPGSRSEAVYGCHLDRRSVALALI